MKCSWFLRLSVIPFLSISLYAQSSMTAKASGACNTAIAGGSGNKITISCTGISGAEAAKLTTLMNRILNQHLDLNEVNSRLDQLSGEMRSLNSALNPMAGAPKPLRDLDDEGGRLSIACSSFVERWSTSAAGQTVLDYTTMQVPGHADTVQLLALRDSRLKVFRTTLGPRIDSLFERYLQAGLDKASFPDYRLIKSPNEIDKFNLKIATLYNDCLISESSRRTSRPESYQELNHLHEELNRSYQEFNRLHNDIQNFRDSWAESAQTEVRKDQVDQDANQTKLYRKTLMPDLIVWRAMVLRYLPSTTDDMDYAISTVGQLSSVCGDVSLLRSAFQTEVSHSLRSK